MDINWHQDISYIPAIEEYFLMCGMKTGSLARLAAELGSFAAGASPETARQLGDAAEKLGIGFQILDDVKNLTTGNPGKKRGDDIIEGKKSLPVLLFLHKSPENQTKLFYCFHVAKNEGINVPEVEDLIETLISTGILAEAEEKGRSLINEAREVFGSHALFGGFFDLIG
jgi:octaprenyl-diphosphate synthase